MPRKLLTGIGFALLMISIFYSKNLHNRGIDGYVIILSIIFLLSGLILKAKEGKVNNDKRLVRYLPFIIGITISVSLLCYFYFSKV